MAQDNEQVCLLAFNIFSFVCVAFSCMTIYDLQKKYQGFSDPEREACMPYIAWKSAFLMHMVFFFMCLAFSVGTAQTYLEDNANREEDTQTARRLQIEAASPNERMYRLKFDKMIENALDVLKLCCLSFCGPTVLIECVITIVWYGEIVGGCKSITDGFMNVLIYVLLICGCISLAVTGFLGYSTFILGKTMKDVWPQILNPPPIEENEDDAESIISSEDRRDSVPRNYNGGYGLMEGRGRSQSLSTGRASRISLGSYGQRPYNNNSVRLSNQEYEDHLAREMQYFLRSLSMHEDEEVAARYSRRRLHSSSRVAPPPLQNQYSIQNADYLYEDDEDEEDRYNEYDRVVQQQDEGDEDEGDDEYYDEEDEEIAEEGDEDSQKVERNLFDYDDMNAEEEEE